MASLLTVSDTQRGTGSLRKELGLGDLVMAQVLCAVQAGIVLRKHEEALS